MSTLQYVVESLAQLPTPAPTPPAPVGASPSQVVQDIFLYVAVPILGITCIVAAVSAHLKMVGYSILAGLLGAAFVYGSSTFATAGPAVATAIMTFLHL